MTDYKIEFKYYVPAPRKWHKKVNGYDATPMYVKEGYASLKGKFFDEETLKAIARHWRSVRAVPGFEYECFDFRIVEYGLEEDWRSIDID